MRHGKQHAGLAINVPYKLEGDQAATRRGGQWHASTVRYVLRNDAYADLVGREMFDQAQARLQALRPGPPR